MTEYAFAHCHPAVLLLFFGGAIVLTVVLFHPVYLLVSLVCAAACYMGLKRRKSGRALAFLLGVLAVVAAVNPLFNTLGQTVLFTLFHRPYTWEALCYGVCGGMMFAAVSLWFLCAGLTLTADKFTALFGRMLPAVSLILVMVLRLIPAYWRKAKQISGARKCIGRSGIGTRKERLEAGITTLSALSGWALEGSIITADSMRCRGYGVSDKHTTFQLCRFTRRDGLLTAGILLALAAVIAAAAGGSAQATFVPALQIAPVCGARAVSGVICYGIFLMIPTLDWMREALVWHSLQSKI